MPIWEVRIAAAKAVLGLADRNELYGAVDTLLSEGVCTESLIDLFVRMDRLSHNEAVRLLQEAVSELGLEMPGPEEAIGFMLRAWLLRLLEGEERPVNVLTDFALNFVEPLAAGGRFGELARRYDTLAQQFYEIDHRQALGELANPAAPGVRRYEENLRRQWRDQLREEWPFPVVPDWVAPGSPAHSLAAGIAAGGAFERLPVLADALEEAGCRDADVLQHLRAPAGHARCCWVVERLLEEGQPPAAAPGAIVR